MTSKLCKDGTIEIPKKFMEQNYVRETSRFGQFIINEEKRKNKEKIKFQGYQSKSFTKLQLLKDVVLDKSINIEEYLELIDDVSKRGFIYEALWDVVILLKFLPEYKKNYDFYAGKIETQDILSHSKIDTFKYLENENVISGNSRGVSDITLIKENISSNKNDGWACSQSIIPEGTKMEIIFFSSKYFEKEKSIDYYDIDRIFTVGENIMKKYNVNKSFQINLLVKDKNDFWKKFEKSKSLKYAYEGTFGNVFDLNDLCNIIQQMREDKDNILRMQEKERQRKKPSLSLRFHQLLFVLKSLDVLCNLTPKGFVINTENNDKNKTRILWGQIPRSGKTYTAGLLVSKLNQGKFFDNMQTRNCVLVITPAPKETIDQFKKDLFETYSDFSDFEVLRYDNKLYKELENKKKILEINKKYIFIASKQFLQGVKNTTYNEDDNEEIEANQNEIKKKCIYLIGRIGLLFFDEIHYGGSTIISNTILNSIDPNNNALQVFLTATYKKPVMWYNIYNDDKYDRLMLWGMDDIRLCKEITHIGVLEQFENKYGINYIQRTLNELCLTYQSTIANILERIENEYKMYPDIHFITSIFSKNVEELLKSSSINRSTEYGFDINSVFSIQEYINGDTKYHKFIDEGNVERLLIIVETKVEKSIMPILQEYNTSQKHVFTSQLWFLPFFKGNRIAQIAPLVKRLMENKGLFKDYEIITLIGTNEDKNTVKIAEMKAWREQKKGLIILVGKKLSLGVSLPCTDLVVFLNNDSEVDVIYQRMFRSLTERDGKKVGFIMDMNPIRTISTMLEYSFSPETFQNGMRPSIDIQMKKLEDMINNKVIYIDADVLELNEESGHSYKELYNKVNKMLTDNEYIRVTRTLDENIDLYMNKIFKDFNIREWMDIVPKHNKKKQKIIIIDNTQGIPLAKPKYENNGDNTGIILENTKIDEKNIYKMRKSIMNMWKDIIVITAFMVTSSKTTSSISGYDISSSYSNSSSFTQILERMIPYLDEKPYHNIKTCFIENEKEVKKVDRLLKQLFCIKMKPIIMVTQDKPEEYFTTRVKNMMTEILKDSSNESDINKIFNDSKAVLMNIDNTNSRELHAYVEKYLPPKEHEMKEYGEVFTPLSLVEEMLGAITTYTDKNFWKNPDLKILDPAAGIGNFPLIAYEKLMNGLKQKIPNEEKRRKHILENMLYMIELNPVNVRIMKRIFNGKIYKLNIIQGDALEEKTHKKLFEKAGTDKFDLVMGNPPYNDEKGISGGGNNLYQRFVNTSLNILVPNGIIVMITPTGILKTTDYKKKTFFIEAMERMSIKYININHSKKYFPNIGSNFVYFIVKNKKSKYIKQTLCEVKGHLFEDNNVDISSLNWIPIIATNTSIRIIKKCSLTTFSFKRDKKLSNFKNKIFMKRLNHLNYNNPSMFPNYDFKNNNHNEGEMIYHDVSSEDEAKMMCSILDSKLFKFINIVSRFDAVIYHNLLNQFGIPKIRTYRTLNDKEVYELYSLTKEEINLIESVVA